MNESRCRICLFVFPKFIPLECSETSSTADGMSPLGGIRGLAGGLSALAPASSDLTIQQMARQGRRLDPLGQGYEILSLESFDTLTEQFRLCRTKSFVTFERGNLSSGDEEFIFFRATAASSTKTVTEMPTVTSLSKRMKERFVFNCLHTTLSLFSVFLSLHSYHDSPPRCRPRGRHVPRAPCAGRPGEIWRKREQESTVVQARRDRGDDYQGFK